MSPKTNSEPREIAPRSKRRDMTRGAREAIRLVPVVCLALAAAFPAHAHHSTAGRYDPEETLEIEGVITEVRWRNPHAQITMRTEGDEGAEVEWEVEAVGIAALERAGLTADLLDVGDRIRVAGWAPLTERRELFIQNILLPSGEELLTGPGARPRWSDERRGDFAFWGRSDGDRSQPELAIFRVWSSTNLLPRLFDLQKRDVSDYPLTEAGRARMEAYMAERENVAIQECTPKGMPLIMEQPYPMEFVHEGEDIALHIEEYDIVRVIHVGEDAAAAGEDEPHTPFGYSTGRWDGDTLVVTTTRLNWPWLVQAGAPLSEEVVLEERFTPIEEGSLLDYQLTVTDPAMYTEPVTRAKQWIYLPDAKVQPYECTVAEAE